MTKAIDTGARGLTIFLTVLMIIVVGINVFCRYLLGFSFGWGEELPRYCLVWITFTGAIVATKRHQMMAITFLLERLPLMLRRPLQIAGNTAGCLFLIVAMVYGCKLVLATRHQASPALQIPMSYIYLIIPLGCAGILFNIVENIIGLIRAPRQG